jgi:hypothetical protein
MDVSVRASCGSRKGLRRRMGQFAAADAVENVQHLLRLTSVGKGAGTATGCAQLRRREMGGHGAKALENKIGLARDARWDQCLSR